MLKDPKNGYFYLNPWHFFILLLLPCVAWSQETIVSGKVTDVNTGDPIPYVNVVFVGTAIGITTDFEGNYTLKTKTPSDSLVVSYIGYKAKKKAVQKGVRQIINFQIEEDVTKLQEVVFLCRRKSRLRDPSESGEEQENERQT